MFTSTTVATVQIINMNNTTLITPNATLTVLNGCKVEALVTGNTPTTPVAYTALAVLHLVVVVLPALALNSAVLLLLSSLPKEKRQLSTAFYWTCTASIVGPCTYGLLMDLSLLSGQPILGDCLVQWQGGIYWYSHHTLISFLNSSIALQSVLVYLTVSSSIKAQRWKVNVAHTAVFLALLIVMIALAFGIETRSATRCHICGSFCLVIFTDQTTVTALGAVRVVIGFPMPALVVLSTFILSVVKLKGSSINKKLMQSTLRLVSTMLVGTFLITAPATILFFRNTSHHGFHRDFIELVSTYCIQLNYVLHPVLILTLHKQVRERPKTWIHSLLRMRATRRIHVAPVNV